MPDPPAGENPGKRKQGEGNKSNLNPAGSVEKSEGQDDRSPNKEPDRRDLQDGAGGQQQIDSAGKTLQRLRMRGVHENWIFASFTPVFPNGWLPWMIWTGLTI